MIQRLLPLLFLSFLACTSFAIDANITYATFKGLDKENYIEVYLQVIGKSIEFKKIDESYQASVEVTLIFYNEDDEIAAYDKYILKNPPELTRKKAGISLVDMKRLELPNGDYKLEVKLVDNFREGNENTYYTSVKMKYDNQTACLSDIQLLENYIPTDIQSKYTKHGYFLKPYTYTVYPSFVNTLAFFAEVYNTDVDLGEDYLVKFYIREADGDDRPLPGLMGFRKQSPERVNLIMMEMNITDIPTGDYDLVVQIRDQKNQEVFSKALRIKRSNPQDFDYADYELVDTENTFVTDLTDEEIYTSLNSLAPVMDEHAIPLLQSVLQTKDRQDDRQFLYHHWIQYNELDPEILYENYMGNIAYVNSIYDTAFDEGYETDRGYVFLKYGPPNDVIERSNEPGAPPYEIWKYYNLNENQRNASFIFYNPSLAPGNFVLLHSNVRGEVNNPQWESELYSDLGPGTPKEEWDGTSNYKHYGGGEARAYFEQY